MVCALCVLKAKLPEWLSFICWETSLGFLLVKPPEVLRASSSGSADRFKYVAETTSCSETNRRGRRTDDLGAR